MVTAEKMAPEVSSGPQLLPGFQRLVELADGAKFLPEESLPALAAEVLRARPEVAAAPAEHTLQRAAGYAVGREHAPAVTSVWAGVLVTATVVDSYRRTGRRNPRSGQVGARIVLRALGELTGTPVDSLIQDTRVKPENQHMTTRNTIQRAGAAIDDVQRQKLVGLLGDPHSPVSSFLAVLPPAPEPAQKTQRSTPEVADAARREVNDSVAFWRARAARAPLLDAPGEVRLAKRIEAGLYAGQVLADEETFTSMAKQELLARQEYLFQAGEPALTAQEEAALVAELRRDLDYIARRGETTKNNFLEANLRLVIHWATRIHRNPTAKKIDFMDFIQEGNLGLIRAVEKFDYTRGYKFSTYATWWVKQFLWRAVARHAELIKVPLDVVEELDKVRRVTREWEKQHGREPDHDELAKEADITPEALTELLQYNRSVLSLDHSTEDPSLQMANVIPDDKPGPEHVATTNGLREQFLKLLDELLTPLQAAVIRISFGFNDYGVTSMPAVGRVLGIPSGKATYARRQALAILAEHEEARVLLYELRAQAA